jgi:1-deoxy-D-xylulose-5-phosphate reductoisomerase
MNKGLEVIEAAELFDVAIDRIDVVVHPQSVVHSMVEWSDGATIAQLSMPDMRLPIGYALSWPSRLDTAFGSIDWASLGALTFEAPDLATFRCLGLAFAAARAGGLAPARLNAANEVAVAAFLDRRIGWAAIADVVDAVLDASPSDDVASVVPADAVYEADREARAAAERAIETVLR